MIREPPGLEWVGISLASCCWQAPVHTSAQTPQEGEKERERELLHTIIIIIIIVAGRAIPTLGSTVDFIQRQTGHWQESSEPILEKHSHSCWWEKSIPGQDQNSTKPSHSRRVQWNEIRRWWTKWRGDRRHRTSVGPVWFGFSWV